VSPDARRVTALLAKADSLDADLRHWLDLSEADADLPEHHSQIRAVTAALAPHLERLRAQAEEHPEAWADTEQRLAALYQLWGFVRDKLTLRTLPTTRRFLALADDFAWACYAPAHHAAQGARPALGLPPLPAEPPLVFLAADAVPFTRTRGRTLSAAPDAPLPGESLAAALGLLPVPLVGVPWFQLGHLPEVLVVAHEVGHCVLEDLGLGPALRTVVAAEYPAQPAAWWLDRLHEAFADLYGTLAAGPAYAQVLADFVAVRPEAPDAPGYPPSAVRLALAADALTVLGLPAEADRVRARWGAEFRAFGEAPDVRRFAETVLTTPLAELGGSRLADLFPVARSDTAARSAAAALLDGDALLPAAATPHNLLQAAALAFVADPEGYRTAKPAITERVQALADTHRVRGLRGPAGQPGRPGEPSEASTSDEALWQLLGGQA